MVGKPTLCPHGVLGKTYCPLCKQDWDRKWRNQNRKKYNDSHKEYRKTHLKRSKLAEQRSRLKSPEKRKIYRLISHHSDRYPLDTKCVFCGRTTNLQHAHLDYEDDGFNYVTACSECNHWMEMN